MKFGQLTLDPLAYGSQGSAVLGIRDSGKTYTATLLAERLFDAGIPFIAFDPVGVWRFLRVPGKGRGYPVVVAGGQEGDLPLSPATAPAIVEAAMQQGISLVIDLFSIDLSKSDWRKIVRDCVLLLLHKNKPHGMRHVFIEEAAEFCPQKVWDGEVYAAVEKLARMGGNSRLGYTLINQRAEEVNKAVLELCDNLFLHRQKGKNSLTSLQKWLDVGAAKGVKAIIDTLSTLPSGECWAWMAGTETPVHVKVPAKNSLHPDRRVMRDTESKPAAAVDVGKFVASLQAALPKVEAEVRANDPKALRARVSEMERQISSEAAAAPSGIDENSRQDAYDQGYAAGAAEGRIEGEAEGRKDGWAAAWLAAEKAVSDALSSVSEPPAGDGPVRPLPPIVRRPAPSPAVSPTAAQAPQPKVAHGLEKRQQKILDAIAWWNAAGIPAPSRPQIAGVSGYAVGSGNFNNILGSLSTAALIEYPSQGLAQLTAEGRRLANRPAKPSSAELHSRVQAVLDPRHWKLLAELLRNYPREMTREELGKRTDYTHGSGNFNNLLGKLSSLEMVTYPRPGRVKAADWLFV